MQVAGSDEGSPDSRAIEILARLVADQEAGALAPLVDYLADFPGSEVTVAREYLRCVEGPARPNASAPTPADEGADGDEQRLGPYALVRELGRGGQGTVWLARDTRLGREVALKIVPRSPLSGGISRRFEREARAASQLDHPGLCQVYDVGAEEALAWIAMRYVPGRTCAQALAEEPGPARDVDTTVELVERTARALHAAHEAGIVHRDVKPANVIVTPGGRPVVLDFGIARQDEDGAPLTLTGDALGTPAYMSPEQLTGERVDRRTDVWSLGATAYELLSGVRAFDAPTREGTVDLVLRREPEPLQRSNRRVSRDLDIVVRTALAKEVDRRYRTALDFAEDLERARTGRPIRARAARPDERLVRWARRNPGLAASVTGTFVVLAVALVLSMRLLSETSEALEANAVLLDELVQLADAKTAGDLLAELETLWPATPAQAPKMRTWLDRALALEGRLDGHRQALETVAARMKSEVSAQFASAARTETDAWVREQLQQIIGSVERLVGVIPRLEERYELADTLAQRTIHELEDEWAAAADRVRADPRFRGLELRPQLGLVPLGPDPESGLEEFAHLQSGHLPALDPRTGRPRLDPESAIVLVLIPGGLSTVGCDPPSPARPLGDDFVDPDARDVDGPVHEVRLDPFFLSKYEMTTGQWVRHTNEPAPSYAYTQGHAFEEEAWLHPIEQVNAIDVARVLAELSLALPTEAQWERAARGDTTTVFYTGNEPESLIGHVNLSDAGVRENGGPPRWEYVEWLADGYVVTAPVGRFLPNPFGLHDVCGNVYEWTRSPWRLLADKPPLDGDGRPASVETTARVVRGGSYAKPELYARSGHREGIPRHLFPPDIGVRPARALDLLE